MTEQRAAGRSLVVFRAPVAARVVAWAFVVALVLFWLPLLTLGLTGEGAPPVPLRISILLALALAVAVLWRAARTRIELHSDELVTVGVLGRRRTAYGTIVELDAPASPLAAVRYRTADERWHRLPHLPFNAVSGRGRAIPDELARRIQGTPAA